MRGHFVTETASINNVHYICNISSTDQLIFWGDVVLCTPNSTIGQLIHSYTLARGSCSSCGKNELCCD